MLGHTPVACGKKLLYELGTKAGKNCPTSMGQGRGEHGSPLTRAGLGKYTNIPQFQLLPAAPLCLPAPGYSDGSTCLGLGVVKTRWVMAHTLQANNGKRVDRDQAQRETRKGMARKAGSGMATRGESRDQGTGARK